MALTNILYSPKQAKKCFQIEVASSEQLAEWLCFGTDGWIKKEDAIMVDFWEKIGLHAMNVSLEWHDLDFFQRSAYMCSVHCIDQYVEDLMADYPLSVVVVEADR